MLAGLAGKSAVVTGAAGGIGSAVVRRLVSEGVGVIAVDRRIDDLADMAAASDLVHPVEGDVTDPASARAAVEACVGRFGSVDLFLANAGVESAIRTVADFDPDDFHRVFGVNVLGAFLGAQAAVRQMSSQPTRGSILFTASTGALKGTAGMSIYAASKHSVLGLSRSLAKEMVGTGIRVNTLCPGPVDTRMISALNDGRSALLGVDAEELRRRSESSLAAGRYLTTDEVAAAVAWIFSDECAFMHDEVVTLGGGSL